MTTSLSWSPKNWPLAVYEAVRGIPVWCLPAGSEMMDRVAWPADGLSRSTCQRGRSGNRIACHRRIWYIEKCLEVYRSARIAGGLVAGRTLMRRAGTRRTVVIGISLCCAAAGWSFSGRS